MDAGNRLTGHADAVQPWLPPLRTAHLIGPTQALRERHDDTSSLLTDMACCMNRASRGRPDTPAPRTPANAVVARRSIRAPRLLRRRGPPAQWAAARSKADPAALCARGGNSGCPCGVRTESLTRLL